MIDNLDIKNTQLIKKSAEKIYNLVKIKLFNLTVCTLVPSPKLGNKCEEIEISEKH